MRKLLPVSDAFLGIRSWTGLFLNSALLVLGAFGVGCGDDTRTGTPLVEAGTDASVTADASPDACVPSCGANVCGDDGCGGSCGTCAEGECVEGMCQVPMTGLCPPQEPFSPDGVAPNVTLMDCDGNEHSLHELCEAPASWVFQYTGWCPPCNRFAQNLAGPTYRQFEDQGVEAWFIITEQANPGLDGPPDAEFCRQVRSQFNLPMTVLYDPQQVFTNTMTGARRNSYSFVMREGNQVTWRAQYQEDNLPARIQEALADR
ncbi:MAG: redoxin domain-containing protein [Myxococcota bacterium]